MQLSPEECNLWRSGGTGLGGHFLRYLAALLLLVAIAGPARGYQRTVLYEHFTASW